MNCGTGFSRTGVYFTVWMRVIANYHGDWIRLERARATDAARGFFFLVDLRPMLRFIFFKKKKKKSPEDPVLRVIRIARTCVPPCREVGHVTRAVECGGGVTQAGDREFAEMEQRIKNGRRRMMMMGGLRFFFASMTCGKTRQDKARQGEGGGKSLFLAMRVCVCHASSMHGMKWFLEVTYLGFIFKAKAEQ